MTKKEEQPRKPQDERENHPRDLDYNPEITDDDKEVLNNQSHDQNGGDYFEEREEPIDYAGEDLDIPLDDQKFNQTTNQPDDIERARKSKDSANTNENLDEDSETIYKNEEAEKYRDPSEKTRKEK